MSAAFGLNKNDPFSDFGEPGSEIKYPDSYANREAKMLFHAFGFRSQEREKRVGR